MDIASFSTKVVSAALALKHACPFGEPSEEQVCNATRDAGLPISHEGDSFIVDPVRMAVVVNAYNIGGTGKMTEMTARAWGYFDSLPKAA